MKIDKQEYVAPVLRDLGTLQQMTAMAYNKVGSKPDMYSTNENDVVGSLILVP